MHYNLTFKSTLELAITVYEDGPESAYAKAVDQVQNLEIRDIESAITEFFDGRVRIGLFECDRIEPLELEQSTSD